MAADLKEALRRALPPGLDALLDLEDTDDPGRLLLALGQVLQDTGDDPVERLRAELSLLGAGPLGIADREAACGLAESESARNGSWEQRRQQVIARLREAGPPTLDHIRAVVQPFLQYSNMSDIAIVEVPRDDLRILHSRVWGGPATTPPTIHVEWVVADDPVVSATGAQVDLYLTSVDLSLVTATLTTPDGYPVPFGGGGGIGRGSAVALLQPTVRLYAREVAGRSIAGTWQLSLVSAGGPDTLLGATLFVEGIGRNAAGGDGLGAAKFQWAVVVEDAKLGPGYNLAGAAAALRRINYATRSVFLARRSIGGGALPPGSFAAVVDDPNCLADAALCG